MAVGCDIFRPDARTLIDALINIQSKDAISNTSPGPDIVATDRLASRPLRHALGYVPDRNMGQDMSSARAGIRTIFASGHAPAAQCGERQGGRVRLW